MVNEVIETIATTASAISNAASAAGGIKGFIQSHPIASVAAAAGVTGAGTGVTVRAVTVHRHNKQNPYNKKNFFGKPKKEKD